jgi:regulator of RNase E activity RraA
MTNEELEVIRKRAEAASPGPWSYQFAIGIEVINAETTIVADDDGVVRYPDAEFIADAREDIPMLLAEIERLRSHLDRIVGAVYEYEPEGTALYDIAEAIDNDENQR